MSRFNNLRTAIIHCLTKKLDEDTDEFCSSAKKLVDLKVCIVGRTAEFIQVEEVPARRNRRNHYAYTCQAAPWRGRVVRGALREASRTSDDLKAETCAVQRTEFSMQLQKLLQACMVLEKI